MARLKDPSADLVRYHEDFEEAPPSELPVWTRDWIVDAITRRTPVYEEYRKMEWDLEGDIIKAMGAFAFDARSGPDVKVAALDGALCPVCGHPKKIPPEYSPEDAAFDLRQIFRRLLRRYAFAEARQIESRLWCQEKAIWEHLTTSERRKRGNAYLFRLWRLKDLVVWRLAIAVLVGFALLASSSGLCDALWKVYCHDHGFYWLVLITEIVAAYLLALVEVQRRAGRRPWLRVLGWRAVMVTGLGALWAGAGAAVQFLAGSELGYCIPARFAGLCAASALLLGFVCQLFWQEGSIAEPL